MSFRSALPPATPAPELAAVTPPAGLPPAHMHPGLPAVHPRPGLTPPAAQGVFPRAPEDVEAGHEAVELALNGVVQGVGFRPYVHRLAMTHGLNGWVRNEAGAVRIHAEGRAASLRAFRDELPRRLPPLARVDRLDVHPVEPRRLRTFEVVASSMEASGRLPVSPDVATCAACEAELRNPTDRRYRYPFITCTDCGPRFTVIESMPYDRVRTTMRPFAQCARCSAEYHEPGDRRYHSETNSCPECGPSVWYWETPSRASATVYQGSDAVRTSAQRLLAGGIVAIRGLGGFHLAVRADRDDAVERLRRRKSREAKPLAVMVATLADARRIAHVSEAEARELTSPQRPIVVLRGRRDAGMAEAISPGLDSVGVMLAYTPLHHLLLDAVAPVPLVMTSGNASDEPIAIGNDEAVRRLSLIADAFLLHDREIVARYDDSVLRVAAHGPIVLRRSRGYAPMPLALPVETAEPILAVGPHLKNTFTLAAAGDAWVSQHIGDLETLEARAHFEDALGRLEALFHIRPTRVVRDLHPGYLSTTIAEESGLDELEPVQHHHAHIAAVLGEHGLRGPVVGLALDGTGFGTDGKVWGCEVLVADLVDFRRVARLRYAPLPGGDRAARTPWRSLLGYASLEGNFEGPPSPSSRPGGWVEPGGWAEAGFHRVDRRELDVAIQQIARGLNAPHASSLGRLFDAAAAILGVRSQACHEGQAAMELEALAGDRPGCVLPFPVHEMPEGETGRAGSIDVIDPVPLLRALAEGRRCGRAAADLAADFHETVADTLARVAWEECRRNGLDTVALGGGCLQNARLSDTLSDRLEARGVRVLLPRALSPNDGAVSYGQAVVAAARMARASASEPLPST